MRTAVNSGFVREGTPHCTHINDRRSESGWSQVSGLFPGSLPDGGYLRPRWFRRERLAQVDFDSGISPPPVIAETGDW